MDLMSNDAVVLERNIKCRWARPQNPKGTLKGRLVANLSWEREAD